MKKGKGIQLSGDLDIMIDPRRDAGGTIISGLNVGDTLYQNQYMILAAQKGEIKEFPDMGVGLEEIVNDNQIPAWRKTIYQELEKDGFRVTKVDIRNGSGEMSIFADYE